MTIAVVAAVVGHLTHPLATILGAAWASTLTIVLLLERRRAVIKMAMLAVLYCGLGVLFRFISSQPTEGGGLSSGRKKGEVLQSRDVIRKDRFLFSLGREFETDLAGKTVSTALQRAFVQNEIRLPAKTPIKQMADGGAWIIGSKTGGYRITTKRDDSGHLEVSMIGADPVFQHDPFYSFGLNTLYLCAVLSLPLILACGIRQRELLYVGILGASVLVCCHYEPLGRLLGKALSMSIFWRARWMIPQLINVGLLGVILSYACTGIVRRGGRGTAPATRLATSIAVILAFAIMLASTTSQPLKVGKSPKDLAKFFTGAHELVEILGGAEAGPFVWGTFIPHHELPQLMPNVKLVYSRKKFMRPADDPDFRRIVDAVTQGYSVGRFNAKLFRRLLELYPIDHVIVDYRYRDSPKRLRELLAKMGWRQIGRAKPYEVWQSPGSKAHNSGSDQTDSS